MRVEHCLLDAKYMHYICIIRFGSFFSHLQ